MPTVTPVPRPSSRGGNLLVPVSVLLVALLGAALSAQQVFRAGSLIVPVDVRAVDRDGNPVTDLTATDFVILENGVEQQISHLITQDFTKRDDAAGTDGARAGLPLIGPPSTQEAALTAQPSRVFLVVLGRGRLQEPNRGLDAVSHLIENRLLSGDRVAIMAWNRATPFTADHAAVAEVVDRFTASFAKIEVDIAGYFSGLAGLYREPGIPAFAQPAIDAVFDGAAGMRSTLMMPSSEDPRDREQRRRATSVLLSNPEGSEFNEFDELVAANEGMSLEDIVASRNHTALDVANLQAGIEYLRHVPGEKHIVYVSQGGLDTVSDRLLQVATSARVAVHIVHTGGLGGPSFSFDRQVGPVVGRTPDPIGSYLYRGATMFTAQVAQRVASETGGTFYAARHRLASQDIDAMDRATRFQYTLGYYPIDERLDQQYRRIEVRVKRPGVTLHYRRGYFASPPPAFDRRGIMAYTRISRAFEHERDVADISVDARASWASGEGGLRRVRVQATIAAAAVAFAPMQDRQSASLDVAVFLLDGRLQQVGQLWQRLELNLRPDSYERAVQQGLPHEAALDATPDARRVKVIVYDPVSDKLGSTTLEIR